MAIMIDCLILLLCGFFIRTSVSQCPQTTTSLGQRTLRVGERACDATLYYESMADLGKRYVVCSPGFASVVACPDGLWFDITTGQCGNKVNCGGTYFPNAAATTTSTTTTTRPTTTTTKPTTTTTRPTTTTTKPTTTTTRPTTTTTKPTTTTTRPTTTTTKPTTTTTRPTTTTTRPTTTTTRATTTTTRPTTTTTRPTTTTTRRTTTTTTTTRRPPPVKPNPPQYSVSRCLDVPTFTGIITMQEADVACDQLSPTETYHDRGKRYIICAAGSASIQNCPPPLRLNINTGLCDWLANADCGGPAPPATTTTKAPTTTTTSTAKPPVANPGAAAPTTTPKRTTTTTTTTRRPPAPAPPSGPCKASNCKLPACFCSGATPSMPLADRPMFIMPTFDDAVTARQYNSYFKSLFVDNVPKITNPNGCRMRSTYYVSDKDTDYNLVRNLYNAKNEIASHTINHRLPLGNKQTDYPDMVAEIDGLRTRAQQNTGISNMRDQIVGFRAPYLRVAGDIMFDVLRDYNFLYDTSITNTNAYQKQDPLWPFTLDYVITNCVNPPCPTKSYPGLWEVPMNGWVGDNGYSCSMVDACIVNPNIFNATEAEWLNLYMRNFRVHFYPKKIPMHFFTHGAMFIRSLNSYPAFGTWLKTLMETYNDVWVVTPKEVIEWMKNPLTNSQMIAQKWGC